MPRAILSSRQIDLQLAQRVNAAVRDAQSATAAVSVSLVSLETTTAGLDVGDINAKLLDYEARLEAGGL